MFCCRHQSVGLAIAHVAMAVVMATTDHRCLESTVRPSITRNEDSDVILIGLFDVHEGNDCDIMKPGGLEQMHVALGTLEQLNGRRGFKAYDTCSNVQTALRVVLHALHEVGYLKDGKCGTHKAVGVLGPSDRHISHHVSNLLSSLDVPHFPIQMTSLLAEIKALVSVLRELKWQKVALFASNRKLELEFHLAAEEVNVCVAASTIFPTTWVESSHQEMFARLIDTGTEVVVVVGSDSDLYHLLIAAKSANMTGLYWLLAGINADSPDLTLLGPAEPVILVQQANSPYPFLLANLTEAYQMNTSQAYSDLLQEYFLSIGLCEGNSSAMPRDLSLCKKMVQVFDPLLTETAEAVTKFAYVTQPTDSPPVSAGVLRDRRDRLPNETDTTDGEELESAKQQNSEIKIWTYQHSRQKHHNFVEVGSYENNELSLDKKKMNILQSVGSGWFRIPEFHCYKCDCVNHHNATTMNYIHLKWRTETWLTVTLTISSIGSLVALAIIVYLVARICHEDTVDGNQGFAIVTLMAITFSYCCTLTFAFNDPTNKICSLRIILVGVAYMAMFSPVVSRCFMLATADAEGLPGHLSGLIQSVLCFFIGAVQVALALCFWWINVQSSTSCSMKRSHVAVYLSYVMFLGVLWLLVSPFCVRSHRSYREGLLLHVASLATMTVWVVWLLMFFLLPPKWGDLVLCLGLVGTASAILLTVFLPRVYRMTTTMALDAAQVSLRPVVLDISARGQTTSIYESVNHGYNADKDGFNVDMFKDNDECPAPNKMTHL